MHSIHAILVAVFVVLPSTGFAQQPEQNPQKSPADKSITAKIVSTQVIIKREDTRSSTDLVKFNDQLFLTFLERWTEGSSESCIRIMSSKDGSAWSPIATIRQPDKDRYLVSRHPGVYRGLRLDDTPRFSIESKDRLSIRAIDAKFGTREFDTRRMAGWSSINGTDWSYEGPLNEVLQWSEIAWNGGKGYAYGYGGPCSESLAMKILATEDGKKMREIYEYVNFNGSDPERAALFFDDTDRFYCLTPMYGGGRMNRVKGVRKGDYTVAYLGTAEPPYKNWTWKKTNMAIWSPRVVSVPEKGFVAVAEIRSEPIRTSLCSLDVATGKLIELLSFADLRSQQLGIDDHEPLGAEDLPIGLAHHHGHVWVSYNRGGAVHVAKIALKKDVAAAYAWAREKLEASRSSFPPSQRGNNSLPLAKPIVSLTLYNVSVTDKELRHLAAFPKLRTLALRGEGITDAGLKQLVTLKKLEMLSLGGTNISDAGMKHLAKLRNLKRLELAGAQLTGAGIRELAGLPNLQKLSLTRSALDDKALKDVGKFKKLRELNLRKTMVSDDGLGHLTTMPELREITLQSTQVTGEGLRHLAACKSLRTINCWGTGVTNEDIRQLKEIMPNCEVDKTLIE